MLVGLPLSADAVTIIESQQVGQARLTLDEAMLAVPDQH